MTTISLLSNDRLNNLLNLLPVLVDRIKKGQDINDQSFEILLLSIDLETDESYIKELQKWVKLLKMVKENPSIEKDVIIGLKLRGIPEANAILAVNDIIPKHSNFKDEKKIKLSEQHIDFGVVKVGETVTKEIKVLEGNGKIDNEINFLRLSKLNFKKDDIVKITAQGGYEGQILFDEKVVFFNEDEKAELGISIQWVKGENAQTEYDKSEIIKPNQNFFSIIAQFPNNIERDPFETEQEYIKRINEHPWIYAGDVSFSPKKYNPKTNMLLLSSTSKPWVKEIDDTINLPEKLKFSLSFEDVTNFYYSGQMVDDESKHPLIIKLASDRNNKIHVAKILIVPYMLSQNKMDEILNLFNSNPKISTKNFLIKLLKKYNIELSTHAKMEYGLSQGLFESEYMYKKRLAQMGFIKAGMVLFDKNKYDVNLEKFPYSIKLNPSITAIVKATTDLNGYLHMNRNLAKKFWNSGKLQDNISEHGLIIQVDNESNIEKFCIIPYSIYTKDITTIDKLISSSEIQEPLLKLLRKEFTNKIYFLMKNLDDCFYMNHSLPKNLENFKRVVRIIRKKICQIQKNNLMPKLEKQIKLNSYLSVFEAYTLIKNLPSSNINQVIAQHIQKNEKIYDRFERLLEKFNTDQQLPSASISLLNAMAEKILVESQTLELNPHYEELEKLSNLLRLISLNKNQIDKVSFALFKKFSKELSFIEENILNLSTEKLMDKVSRINTNYAAKKFRINLFNLRKQCPKCGKSISAVAVKCKHCKTWLTEDRKPIVGLERIIFNYLGDRYYFSKKINQSGVFFTYLVLTKDDSKIVKKVIVSYKNYGCINNKKLKILQDELIQERKILTNNRFVNISKADIEEPFSNLKIYHFEYPFVEGHNLAEVIQKEKKLNDKFITEIIIKIIEALKKYYQNYNKPFVSLHANNIILDKNNNIKLTPGLLYFNFVDYGKNDSCFQQSPLNQNLRYLSDEIVWENRTSFLSDIYALGVILFEMKTNKIFDPRNFISTKGMLGPFKEIALKALEKNPQNRWESLDEILANLPTT